MKLNENNIKKLEIKIFTILILFITIIIGAYLAIENYVFSNQFEKISLNNALVKIEERESYIKSYLNDAKIQLNTINNSSFFHDYLNNNSKESINQLFLFILSNQKNIMQIRYIDKSGNEKIRIERENISDIPRIVNKNNLQNKSHRDYFKKSKNMKDYKIWFSSLDLNMEYKKIEKPYKSTLRAILPITDENSFNGIIVINYFMDDFLQTFMKDELYNSIILDKDGFIIMHYEQEKSWSKYKNPKIRFTEDTRLFNETILKTEDYVSKILDLPLEENIILILRLNKKYLNEINYQKFLSELSISFIIIFFSVIAIFIVSKVLNQVVLELTNYVEYTKLIDENIITSSTDLKGNIIFASKAFCEVSGYTEAELLGKNHNILRHPDEKANKYKKLWDYLLQGKIWEGEFKNKNKKGETYWVKAKIYPTYKRGIKTGYTAIRQNISDKKIIEAISITDGLTKLYNRKYFDEMLPKFINRAKRNNQLVSFLMIDVDYFKNYNDTYGHQKGDDILIMISKVIKDSLKRANDYSFRIGGEEFVILFSPQTRKDSVLFAEKIRLSIEELKIEHSGNLENPYVTISLGMITNETNNILSPEDLYKDADYLLYESKKKGRNRLVHN